MRTFSLTTVERTAIVAGLRHVLVLVDILDEHAAAIDRRRVIKALIARLQPTPEEVEAPAAPAGEPPPRRWAAQRWVP